MSRQDAQRAEVLPKNSPPALRATDLRVAGLIAFHRKRKQNSYDRLLQAAATRFCKYGYASVVVDDIVADAGVSRMTFYRHFANKASLAAGLFKQVSVDAIPRYLLIGRQPYQDRATVISWVQTLFAADNQNRGILRVFIQAITDEDDFNKHAQNLIPNVISLLGADIPAFAVKRDQAGQREQWFKAWLLIYEILGLSGHAAVHAGVATDPLMIEILADKFLEFVNAHQEPVSTRAGGQDAPSI